MAPLLSICIPSCERAGLLDRTIASIVSEPEFLKTDDVELIVSDNCSGDGTPEVCRRYAEAFPEKIRVFRQGKGIDSHANFEFVLGQGKGEFLKLHNDNAEFVPGMLGRYLEALRRADASVGFVATGADRTLVSDDPGTLLLHVGIAVTWISNFCIRRQLFRDFPEPFRASGQHLPQLDIFLRIVSAGGKAMLLSGEFFRRAHVVYPAGSRNDAVIFGRNYFDIVESVIPAGRIAPEILSKIKRELLFRHIIPYHFDFFGQYFQKRSRGYARALWKHYHAEPCFYASFPYIWFYYLVTRIVPLHQLCGRIRRALKKGD